MEVTKENLSQLTTDELEAIQDNMRGCIESCKSLGVTSPIAEMEQAIAWCDEIIQERKDAAVMKPFTRGDWCEFSGAEKFPDGSDPWFGCYRTLTVVVDRNGLQAWLEDMEDHVFRIDAAPEFKDITISTGNLLLDQAKQKTPAELVEIFQKL